MIRQIGPATAIYGVTGFPLSHTYSPLIHNTLFERYGIDAVYLAFPSTPKSFKADMKKLKKIGISGLNVTIPFKSDIIRLCDTVDAISRDINAVNTVINKEGKWHGTVTDPIGFITAVTGNFKRFTFKKSRVLLLGAGGSAQSVAYASLKNGAREVDVMNRSTGNAKVLVKRMKSCGFSDISMIPFDSDILSRDNEFDLIVNCTSVGLKKGDPCLLSMDAARRSTRLFDLIYNPATTPLISAARKAGLRTANGLDMLVYQAFASFTHWTGIKPSRMDGMRIIAMLRKQAR